MRRRLKQQCERLGDYGSPHVVDGENVHEGNQRVEVLAVLTDVSDERASQVERAFARIYGYKPKQPYTQNWSRNLTREECVENGRKGGKIAAAMFTFEQRSKAGKIGIKKMTEEQRLEGARAGGRITGSINLRKLTKEQRRKGTAIVNARRIECPRGCGLITNPGAMGRHIKAGKCGPKS